MDFGRWISYVPSHRNADGKEVAIDETGETVDLQFGHFMSREEFYSDDEIELRDYVQINGVVHLCRDISFAEGFISFWAEPVLDAKPVAEWVTETAGAENSYVAQMLRSPF